MRNAAGSRYQPAPACLLRSSSSCTACSRRAGTEVPAHCCSERALAFNSNSSRKLHAFHQKTRSGTIFNLLLSDRLKAQVDPIRPSTVCSILHIYTSLWVFKCSAFRSFSLLHLSHSISLVMWPPVTWPYVLWNLPTVQLDTGKSWMKTTTLL